VVGVIYIYDTNPAFRVFYFAPLFIPLTVMGALHIH
jgi:hypothetical protein